MTLIDQKCTSDPAHSTAQPQFCKHPISVNYWPFAVMFPTLGLLWSKVEVKHRTLPVGPNSMLVLAIHETITHSFQRHGCYSPAAKLPLLSSCTKDSLRAHAYNILDMLA